jgi:hypothetical protein
MRPGGAVLMSRGAEEVALAAARHGLGRVLVWTLSDDAEGLRAWADIGRLIVQAARSVRAPAGLGQSVFASVLLDPDGDRLRLDAAPGAPASPVRVLWSGAGEEHDLGLHTPGTGEDLRLPTAAAGTAAWIQLRDEEGHPTGPGLTYLVSAPRVAGPRAGDATRLASVLGAEALQEGSPLFAPAPEGQGREGLWALFALLALLLLPFDVALHRRAGRST